MTDNEKRAHDLTMLYIKEVFRLKLLSSNEQVKPMDFITDYAEYYPKVLEEISKRLS